MEPLWFQAKLYIVLRLRLRPPGDHCVFRRKETYNMSQEPNYQRLPLLDRLRPTTLATVKTTVNKPEDDVSAVKP